MSIKNGIDTCYFTILFVFFAVLCYSNKREYWEGKQMEQEPKKIEIVSGDGTDLQISPVYEHLNLAKPNTNNQNKEIVIPKTKEEIEKEKKKKIEKAKEKIKKNTKKEKEN